MSYDIDNSLVSSWRSNINNDSQQDIQSPRQIYNQISSNILNMPIRVQRGLAVISWELALFKELQLQNGTKENDEPIITFDDMADAYEHVMGAYDMDMMNRRDLLFMLKQIHVSDGSSLLQLSNSSKYIIKYRQYTRSLQPYVVVSKYYDTDIQLSSTVTLKRRHINWHKHGLVVATIIIDCICCLLSVLPLREPLDWIYAARAGAVVILLNIIYLLLPFIGITYFVADKIVAQGFSSEYKEYYHKVFGYKIIIASLVHTIAHVLQIQSVLSSCRDGCERKPLRIVKSDNNTNGPIIISWVYFLKQLPYWSGIVLFALMATLILCVLLARKRLLRYSMNMLVHKYLALFVFICTIIHGVNQLLGFNLSYIFTLPILMAYAWGKRREYVKQSVEVTRWICSDKYIKLFIQDTIKLPHILHSFGTVSIYVNHPAVSKVEWHPFTLSRGYNNHDAILAIQVIGKWTKQLKDVIANDKLDQYINIGSYTLSKFRFHRVYNTRIFFCSGIGVTAFISVMADMQRSPVSSLVRTTLIWSISDTSIVAEFSDELDRFQANVLNTKIYIYYSNGKRREIDSIPKQIKSRFIYLQRIVFGHSRLDIATNINSNTCCLLQRADSYEILSRAIYSAKTRGVSKEPIGVFICGSERYAQGITHCANQLNRNTFGITFRVWSESV